MTVAVGRIIALLACIEEAVTTTMTNLAPIFGVPLGAAANGMRGGAS